MSASLLLAALAVAISAWCIVTTVLRTRRTRRTLAELRAARAAAAAEREDLHDLIALLRTPLTLRCPDCGHTGTIEIEVERLRQAVH